MIAVVVEAVRANANDANCSTDRKIDGLRSPTDAPPAVPETNLALPHAVGRELHCQALADVAFPDVAWRIGKDCLRDVCGEPAEDLKFLLKRTLYSQ